MVRLDAWLGRWYDGMGWVVRNGNTGDERNQARESSWAGLVFDNWQPDTNSNAPWLWVSRLVHKFTILCFETAAGQHSEFKPQCPKTKTRPNTNSIRPLDRMSRYHALSQLTCISQLSLEAAPRFPSLGNTPLTPHEWADHRLVLILVVNVQACQQRRAPRI